MKTGVIQQLHKGQVVAVKPGGWLRVAQGTLWLTTSGQSEDVFLSDGSEYRVPAKGLTLIEAVGEGAVGAFLLDSAETVAASCRHSVSI